MNSMDSNALIEGIQPVLADLVAAASVSSVDPDFDSGNLAVIDLLADRCSALGAAIERMSVCASPAKANLVASFGSGEAGLALSGHADTVPCDPKLWNTDPFSLTARDGRLYGLGAADMKGFFPAVLAAIELVGVTRLSRRLTVVATADEESSMSGARRLAAAGMELGRAVVIGEPTGLIPIRQHKGVIMLKLVVTGRSGHASDPDLGVSALEAMHEVIAALLAFRAGEFGRGIDPAVAGAFTVARPTMNLGAIHGGDNPNRICGQCELLIDVRILPGQSPGGLISEIEQRVADTLGRSSGDVSFELEPVLEPVPAFASVAGSEIVKLTEHLSGHTAKAVNFATEGPFFTLLDMDTVILGAGSIDQAHQPDEYVEVSQLTALVPMLARIIEHYCVD